MPQCKCLSTDIPPCKAVENEIPLVECALMFSGGSLPEETYACAVTQPHTASVTGVVQTVSALCNAQTGAGNGANSRARNIAS